MTISKREFDGLSESQKFDAIWDRLERLDAAVQHSNGGQMALYDRLTKVEKKTEGRV